MRFRFSRTWLIAAAISGLFFSALLTPGVSAQKQGAPLWYSVATVKRVNKPNRQVTRPAPKTQKAALLTLQWRVLRRAEDGTPEEVDSHKEFQTGDRFKMAITANQSGYLYLVNQPEGKDGVLLFPDLRINKGQNSVVKDKEYVLPSYCPEFEDPKDCWWQMVPPAGIETLIVVFSREKITTLPNQIDKPYMPVKRSVVEDLIATSEQKVKQATGALTIPGQKAVRFGTRAQNINLQDNEELIATIELTHAQ